MKKPCIPFLLHSPLLALRTKMRWTQERLAEALGTKARSQVSEVERGEHGESLLIENAIKLGLLPESARDQQRELHRLWLDNKTPPDRPDPGPYLKAWLDRFGVSEASAALNSGVAPKTLRAMLAGDASMEVAERAYHKLTRAFPLYDAPVNYFSALQARRLPTPPTWDSWLELSHPEPEERGQRKRA